MIRRRDIMAFGAAALAGPLFGPSRVFAQYPGDLTSELQRDLEQYDSFGPHHSGGAGNKRTVSWIEGRLRENGFDVRRQNFDAPFTQNGKAEISVGDVRMSLLHQQPKKPDGDKTVSGRLALMGAFDDASVIEPGDVCLIELPLGRYSSILQTRVSKRIVAAQDAGAAALIIWTRTVSGDPIALNTPVEPDWISAPIAVVGEEGGQRLRALAQAQPLATFTTSGRTGFRTASNIIGHYAGREGQKPLVVTTPISGWTHAAGERGPGVAIFLALSRSLPAAAPRRPMIFGALNGHEYENLGGKLFVEHAAPGNAETALWIHLGAGLATRDWHEIGGVGDLLPLPSADPQRFLLASEQHLSLAKDAFSGQPGLENPYPFNAANAAGELSHIYDAGYRSVAGAFAAHRFHHSINDRMTITSGDLIAPVARAFHDFTLAVLESDQ